MVFAANAEASAGVADGIELAELADESVGEQIATDGDEQRRGLLVLRLPESRNRPAATASLCRVHRIHSAAG